MWWVSYRGESGHGVDNIGVFEDDGSPRRRHPLLLDESHDAHALHIARGFALVGDDLYIANAWRKDSHVARYHRHGDMFRFAEVVVATKDLAAMVHPFDVELGDDGRIYISCQDSNTVVAIAPRTRRPLSVAAHLRRNYPNGKFLPGTLVASSQGGLPDVPGAAPADVAPPQGLKVVLDKRGRPRHSVRGIVAHLGHLYVADEAGDAVKIFALRSGRLVARIKGKRLERPVHLLLRDEVLYIGAAGTGSLLAYDIPAAPPAGRLKARTVIDRKLDAPSGIAFGADGNLYVAERRKQRIRAFTPDGKKLGTFIKHLPDVPEFLVHVAERSAPEHERAELTSVSAEPASAAAEAE